MPASRPTTLDRFFALRPLLWIPVIALFEAGRAEAGGGSIPPWGALSPLLSLLGILSAVHVANGWRDRAGDRLNRKGGAVASGTLAPRDLVTLAVLALVIATIAAALSPATPSVRLLLLGSLLLGAAYVTPPIEAKRRPGIDLAAQGIGYGICAFLLGAYSSGAPSTSGAPLPMTAIPYALGVAAIGIVTMLADRLGDEATGQRTTVVALGERRSADLAVALALLTAASGLVLSCWVPALWGLLAAAWLGLEGSRFGWNRAAVGLQISFLLLLAARTPFALVAAVVLGTTGALYDRSRGGAGYPIRGESVGRERHGETGNRVSE